MTICYEHFSNDQQNITWIILLVASMFSLFGSSFILTNYLFHSERKNVLIQLVVFLAIGDWGWAVSNLVACAMNYIAPAVVVDNWVLCVSMRSIYTFFAGSSVAWTSCIAFYLWRAICLRKPNIRNLWYVFHSVSWGLPIAALLVVALGGHKTMEVNKEVGMCFPAEPYHFIFWFVPVILSFVWNLIFCGMICWRIQSESRRGNMLAGKAGHYRFMFYLLVYFICWPLNILNSIVNYLNDGQCQVFFLVCLYILLLNAQGGFDFMVYGLTNTAIRNQFVYRKGHGWRKPLNTFVMFWVSPVLLLPAFFYFLLEKLIGRRLDSRMFGRGDKYKQLRTTPASHSGIIGVPVFKENITDATNYTAYTTIDGDTAVDGGMTVNDEDYEDY